MSISYRQRQMLAYIESFVEENGYPPTLEEIRVGLGISSKSVVSYHLEALEDAALLTRSPNTSRGIRLTGEHETVRIPLQTEMALPPPVAPADLDPQDAIALTYDIVPENDDLYALQVQGDSMLDALIKDGDIVVMQPYSRAANGDMVAAHLIDTGETTFRRYYRENGHVRLEPANPTMEPIIVNPKRVEVQGKVVAIIRPVD